MHTYGLKAEGAPLVERVSLTLHSTHFELNLWTYTVVSQHKKHQETIEAEQVARESLYTEMTTANRYLSRVRLAFNGMLGIDKVKSLAKQGSEDCGSGNMNWNECWKWGMYVEMFIHHTYLDGYLSGRLWEHITIVLRFFWLKLLGAGLERVIGV